MSLAQVGRPRPGAADASSPSLYVMWLSFGSVRDYSDPFAVSRCATGLSSLSVTSVTREQESGPVSRPL